MAEKLGIKPRALRDWRARRIIPYYKVGRVILFDPAKVQAAMDNYQRLPVTGRDSDFWCAKFRPGNPVSEQNAGHVTGTLTKIKRRNRMIKPHKQAGKTLTETFPPNWNDLTSDQRIAWIDGGAVGWTRLTTSHVIGTK